MLSHELHPRSSCEVIAPKRLKIYILLNLASEIRISYETVFLLSVCICWLEMT